MGWKILHKPLYQWVFMFCPRFQFLLGLGLGILFYFWGKRSFVLCICSLSSYFGHLLKFFMVLSHCLLIFSCFHLVRCDYIAPSKFLMFLSSYFFMWLQNSIIVVIFQISCYHFLTLFFSLSLSSFIFERSSYFLLMF